MALLYLSLIWPSSMSSLQEFVALVAGSSDGIGATTSRVLRQAGARVAIN